MMRRHLALLLALLVLPAAAQSPQGFDELLKQIRESSREAASLNREREQRFIRNKSEQEAELARAQAALKKAEARAAQVRSQFDANQKDVQALKQKLTSGVGELSQLYGAVRTTATEFNNKAGASFVAAQFPDRSAFLERMAQGKALPSLPDLEQLWFVLTQEMVENGKVTRFPTTILDRLGNRRDTDVVRVGAFTAFTADGYVTPQPGSTLLQLLPRQPGRRYLGLTDDFAAAAANSVAPILVDPSRGRLLAIEADKPSLFERIDQGGLVGYVIIVIGLIGLLLALVQLLYLAVVGRRMRRQLRSIGRPTRDNPLGRVLTALKEEHAGEAEDAELLELWLSEAVLRETPRLERFQSVLRLFVAVAPLLGLLGTVTGMILTFQTITVFGTGDPKLMAGGISQALVTTVLGLCVAIPLLFINSLLATRSRSLVKILDEQSAAVLAARMEGSPEPPRA